MPKSQSSIAKQVAIVFGAPVFIFMFFYLGSFLITDSILSSQPQNVTVGDATLNAPSNDLTAETQGLIQIFGAGFAFLIFFAILFAFAVRRNIHG